MESIKRIIKYQLKDSYKSLLGFWITISLVNIFFAIMNRFAGVDSGIGLMVHYNGSTTMLSVVGVNLFALIIYFTVSIYENYYKGFPLAISLSITRRDYGISLLVKTLLFLLVSSILQALFFKLDPILVKFSDKDVLSDFLFINSKADNIFYMIFSLFMVFLSFSSVLNLIASLNYRIGYIFWIGLFGFYFIIVSISPLRKMFGEIIMTIGETFTSQIGLVQFLKFIIVIVVFQILAYFNIISTDIKSRKL